MRLKADKIVVYILVFLVNFTCFENLWRMLDLISRGKDRILLSSFDIELAVIAPIFFAFLMFSFLTVPMIVCIVLLIEKYKWKWFKSYFLVTSVCLFFFVTLFWGLGGYFSQILPGIGAQFVVWLLFHRVFDKLDKKYNLK